MNCPKRKRGAWDRFSMRNIGLAVQRRMARDFDGDAEAMRKAAVARLGRELELNPHKLKAQEQSAFADFATVLSLVPDLDRWSSDEKARCARSSPPRLPGPNSVTNICW